MKDLAEQLNKDIREHIKSEHKYFRTSFTIDEASDFKEFCDIVVKFCYMVRTPHLHERRQEYNQLTFFTPDYEKYIHINFKHEIKQEKKHVAVIDGLMVTVTN